MNKDEWVEDINYFVDNLEKLHPNPYRNYNKKDFYKKLDEVKMQKGNLTKDKMIRNIAYLAALLNDAHTAVVFWDCGYVVPMNFEFVEDKLYIVDTKEKHHQALFKEVLFINDIPIESFIKDLEQFISYETMAYKKFEIGQTLDNPALLKKLGLINDDTYKITYNNDGRIDNIEFKYKEKPIYDDMIKPMIYNQGKHRHYDYKHIIEHNALYIKYRSCREYKDYSMENFADDIDKIILKGIDKVIVDIRHNQGGNSEIIKPLIARLKEFSKQNGKIIGLIDSGTFSSGTFALVDLRNIGATIIGSETGGAKGARFGNVETGTLPNSKTKFRCSTKKFRSIEDDQGYLAIVQSGDFETKPNFPMDSFSPDIKVENKIENLREGRDIVLEAALEYVIKRKKL